MIGQPPGKGYRSDESLGVTRTEYVPPPPDLGDDERRVLIELTRPILEGDAFTPAATADEIAGELQRGSDEIGGVLDRLRELFGLDPEDGDGALAREAMRRGAVSPGDLSGG